MATCRPFCKNENEVILKKTISYDHEPDDTNILTSNLISNSLKIKAQQHACESTSKLLLIELQHDIETLSIYDYT